MNTSANPTPAEHPYYVSSTGMVHEQGCGALTVGRSAVRVVSPEFAAKLAKRCMHCNPRPLGTVVGQLDRKAAARAAAAAQHEAAWAAMQSPQLDEALRAFVAAEAAGAPLETCRAAYRRMNALAPEGWCSGRRSRELGILRSLRCAEVS